MEFLLMQCKKKKNQSHFVLALSSFLGLTFFFFNNRNPSKKRIWRLCLLSLKGRPFKGPRVLLHSSVIGPVAPQQGGLAFTGLSKGGKRSREFLSTERETSWHLNTLVTFALRKLCLRQNSAIRPKNL